LYVHSPVSLQYIMTAGQVCPGGHVLQVSPQAFPAHGSVVPPQASIPLTQAPFSQRENGQAALPSGQIWQGASICGQSASEAQVDPAQVDHEPTQLPLTQSTDGQA
jgi:hypothetical protein